MSKSLDGVPENRRFRERGKRGAKVFEACFLTRENVSLADRSASGSSS